MLDAGNEIYVGGLTGRNGRFDYYVTGSLIGLAPAAHHIEPLFGHRRPISLTVQRDESLALSRMLIILYRTRLKSYLG